MNQHKLSWIFSKFFYERDIDDFLSKKNYRESENL